MKKLNQDLVESLRGASRYQEAAELADPNSDFETVLDCYLRCNDF